VEFQKRGAIHFHMLCNLPYVDVNELAKVWKNGFIKLNRLDNVDNVGAYITKYMTKDNVDARLIGKKCYTMSKGLNEPRGYTNEADIEQVLEELDAQGIVREEVTLHVGAGTFRPVKSEEIGGHDMHTEHIAVKRETVERLLAHNGRAIAVGTTSVRTLESLYYMGVMAAEGHTELHVPQWMPYEYTGEMSTTDALKALLSYMDRQQLDVLHSSTQIIIAPGYRYHIVQMMVTNFHQPQSTLLLLVSAFVQGDWRKIYDYALAHDFRFLSYGDSSLLIPENSEL
jgi:S-adenosylmethionine:tRNA-ribosyltransferase-isomerase (queuine synthetase)